MVVCVSTPVVERGSIQGSPRPHNASFTCHFIAATLVCAMWNVIAVLTSLGASLVAQLVKNPPAVWKTWVRSLLWEDPLEKGKATHSSILPCRIPWTEEPGRLQSIGSQRVGHD